MSIYSEYSLGYITDEDFRSYHEDDNPEEDYPTCADCYNFERTKRPHDYHGDGICYAYHYGSYEEYRNSPEFKDYGEDAIDEATGYLAVSDTLNVWDCPYFDGIKYYTDEELYGRRD